ncbi:class IV adenylate cyclase [Mariniblastus fucicola]|uniref:CYTH domain protein n=1 Tax=Mariniblastus fucicola TaxID=980251 RepID=A0A5B9PP84_9BACT|nr:class IV adenylate cyclase [Mariniblastus fucicola]QEG24063.1 CYTH domain protein [Mariniblastus fucicola]
MIEIEKKFQVVSFDAIRKQLADESFDVMEEFPPRVQSDEYFNHRQLRFELQDIALRIREVDNKHILTFKGPNRDATTKIRTEVEVELSAEDAEKMTQMFLGMGMHSVAKVVKNRATTLIRWQGANVEVCLDGVDEVGYFVELEIVADGESEIPAAKEKLESLAEKFGLSDSITTSYLEMLLQSRGQM